MKRGNPDRPVSYPEIGGRTSPAGGRRVDDLGAPRDRPREEGLETRGARQGFADPSERRVGPGRGSSATLDDASYLLDRSYAGRILRLALLAPDIVEAIVEGTEPSGLSLERLVKGVPGVWEEQRARLRFPGQ